MLRGFAGECTQERIRHAQELPSLGRQT